MSYISRYEVRDNGVCVYTPYAEAVVNGCRRMGGKFQDGAWRLHQCRLAEVQKMLGSNTDDPVEVEVGKSDWEGFAQVRVGWFILAGRRGRDNLADIYADLVVGTVPDSGGSVKYPQVNPSDDARFRLWVPRDFATARGLQIVTAPKAKEPTAADLPNPLAAFSDAEILAEFVRRGLTV